MGRRNGTRLPIDSHRADEFWFPGFRRDRLRSEENHAALRRGLRKGTARRRNAGRMSFARPAARGMVSGVRAWPQRSASKEQNGATNGARLKVGAVSTPHRTSDWGESCLVSEAMSSMCELLEAFPPASRNYRPVKTMAAPRHVLPQ